MPDHIDPLEELRSRIRQTQDAAERLAGQAHAARESETPPPGWATAEEHGQRTGEVQALAALLETLHHLIPDDLREQFRELVRQVLLLVRALIDWWVERIDSPSMPAAGPAVEDIPIA